MRSLYLRIRSFQVTLKLLDSANIEEVTGFANYAHTSSQNTEAVVLPALQPGAILEPYGTLNASLDWRDIAHSGVDVGVFATNLTNKLYRISNTDVFQAGGLLYWTTLYGEPRMYGLRLKYRFGAQ